MKRLEFLDGYRGLAILFVVFYHAFSRWPNVVPYGDQFNFSFIKYGYVSINLFFLISGFVILMLLERSKNFVSFIFGRWKRLFPAMLVATIIIYCTAHFFHERPRGIPPLVNIIPGLIFIEPSWLKTIFGIPFNTIEGAFWSLFVEVKFYVVFGALYFLLGRSKSVIALVVLYLCAVIAWYFSFELIDKILTTLSFKFFCWFTGGCCVYLFYISKEVKYLLFCVLICTIEIVRLNFDVHFKYQILAQYIMLGVFLIPFYFEGLQTYFSNKVLLFFGFLSYPLYLIHENAMIAMILKFDKLFDGNIPYFILPLIPIGILVLIAHLIAKYVEPFLKSNIEKMSSKLTQ